jgi:hypothetical protein
MNNNQTRTAQKLLGDFFSICAREFRFLEEDHGFTCVRGLSEYRKGHRLLTPWHEQHVIPADAPFEAVTLYEKDDTAFEILYSSTNRTIDLYAGYSKSPRLQFQEILKAARRSLFVPLEIPVAVQHSTVEKTLQAISPVIQKNINFITAPNPKMIERALETREKHRELKLQEQLERDMAAAAQEAFRAFIVKDYRRVIELFTPYEHNLSFIHLRKLDIARKNLLSV